ncbi:hypothetical protein EW146_g9300 [Bondarzewia mesenterica]|uniref:Uncharacterized protein n=1 Tax=Bondarzewia mesenterica TaxID=1095465 RepID=A0A4S4L7W9_9AGAM|nr:hypothetical protein EW146_g9300 [Bondarzewia mesenterica]
MNSPDMKHFTIYARTLHASMSSHAVLQIIQIWADRLQLISVVSTFFTSIDSILLSLVNALKDHTSTRGKLMDACLAGALVFHASAAILAFTASFVLIRYKLNDAQHPSAPPPAPAPPSSTHPTSPSGSSNNHTQYAYTTTNEKLSASSPWPFFPTPQYSSLHTTPTSLHLPPFFSHASDLLNILSQTFGFGMSISVRRVHPFHIRRAAAGGRR